MQLAESNVQEHERKEPEEKNMNFVVGMLAHEAKGICTEPEYKQIKREAEARFEQLCAENRETPKAMKKHTELCIFPAIAVYETLLKHGMEKEAAVDRISGFFVGLSGKGFKAVSAWLHLFGNYHRYPANFVKNSLRDFSPEAGFEYVMPEGSDPAAARFDIIKCPYHEMCKKYNCPELNRAFCDSDDAKYGHLHPKLMWRRTGTLGKGAACCDFLIADVTRSRNSR